MNGCPDRSMASPNSPCTPRVRWQSGTTTGRAAGQGQTRCHRPREPVSGKRIRFPHKAHRPRGQTKLTTNFQEISGGILPSRSSASLRQFSFFLPRPTAKRHNASPYSAAGKMSGSTQQLDSKIGRNPSRIPSALFPSVNRHTKPVPMSTIACGRNAATLPEQRPSGTVPQAKHFPPRGEQCRPPSTSRTAQL